MKIVKIETKMADIPYRSQFNKDERYYIHGYETGKKTDRWIQRNVIVFVYTDNGLCGIGEAAHSPGIFGETAQGSIGAVNLYKTQLIGMDPFQIVKIHHTMERMTLTGNYAAQAAIDMACYDLMGQSLKVPVYELLGGKTRDFFKTHISPAITDNIVENTQEFIDNGFSIFKVKMTGNVKTDIARIQKLITTFDENILLHLDPNQGWSVSDAIHICEMIAKHPDYKQNIIVEQPVSMHDLDGMAYVTQHTSVPIIADECARTPRNVYDVVKNRAADIINVKLTKAGGLHPAKQCIAIAEAANIPYIVDEINEMHICNTAVAHLAMSAKEIVYGGCTCHLILEKDLVKQGGVVVQGGVATLSDAPGLGIQKLDESLLFE
jgi:L-alanine-DL-glutamate epimerase-like enolase superfamily enzyme